MTHGEPEALRSPMSPPRKSRSTESDRQRDERIAHQARNRIERTSDEENAIDAAVRQSIERHGA
jgi:hypothetical protein